MLHLRGEQCRVFTRIRFMPYPAGHRQAMRVKIIESARRLFNRHGFENVSVKQIMAGAGLTHGAFYGYFNSKSDLYSEVLGCFFTDPNWKNRWEGVEVDLGADDAGAQIVQAYLSRRHFDDIENSCPMVALPSDVQRSGKTVKAAFETVFRAMVGAIGRCVGENGEARATRAQAIAALCVGGLVVARAMRSEHAADELREACMAIALELGGWDEKRSAKGRRLRSSPSRTAPSETDRGVGFSKR
jgi:TetR/AcrR family transcriptional regulator, transcriptional repressor for nem operon